MLATASTILAYLTLNGPALLGAVVAALAALTALFMLVPGDQPEKALQSAVDFLKRFSNK